MQRKSDTTGQRERKRQRLGVERPTCRDRNKETQTHIHTSSDRFTLRDGLLIHQGREGQRWRETERLRWGETNTHEEQRLERENETNREKRQRNRSTRRSK